MAKWAKLALVVVLLALPGTDAFGKKGGGGKGGGGGDDPGNTTPPDIVFGMGDDELYLMQDDGTGRSFLTYGRGRVAWSPDGTEIAFYGDLDGYGIYVLGIEGGDTRKVVSTNGYGGYVAWSPAPAPDGKYKLAFTDHPRQPDGSLGNTEVYLVNLDGTGFENISRSYPIESCVSWSPDGDQVAYVSFEYIRIADLTRRDADGHPAQDTIYDSSDLAPAQPEWAKTSNRIAFTAYDRTLSHPLLDIYTLDVEYSEAAGAWTASNLTNVTNTPDDEEAGPSWSPDDSRIVCKNAHWKSSRKGRATVTIDLVPVGSGTRESIYETSQHFWWTVWKRNDP